MGISRPVPRLEGWTKPNKHRAGDVIYFGAERLPLRVINVDPNTREMVARKLRFYELAWLWMKGDANLRISFAFDATMVGK